MFGLSTLRSFPSRPICLEGSWFIFSGSVFSFVQLTHGTAKRQGKIIFIIFSELDVGKGWLLAMAKIIYEVFWQIVICLLDCQFYDMTAIAPGQTNLILIHYALAKQLIILNMYI